jgi:repressor LexA
MNKDLVLIKKQSVIDYNGQVAVVIVENEGTLKKVYMDNNKIMLVAANEKYPPVAYTGSEMTDVTIAGVVKQLKRKL